MISKVSLSFDVSSAAAAEGGEEISILSTSFLTTGVFAEKGRASKIPGSGSPKVSAGLGAESRKSGSCPGRLVVLGPEVNGVGETGSRGRVFEVLAPLAWPVGAEAPGRTDAGVGGMILGVGGTNV
jgi:hypothetical protein